MNRNAVDTEEDISTSPLFSSSMGLRTSPALFSPAEVDFGTGSKSAFQPTFHRIFLVYPFLPSSTNGPFGSASGCSSSSFILDLLPKVVQKSRSPEPIICTPGILCTPFTSVLLEAQEQVAVIGGLRASLRCSSGGCWGTRVGDYGGGEL